MSSLGLPADPGWADHILGVIEAKKRIEEIDGIGCEPVLISATTEEILEWIGVKLRNGRTVYEGKRLTISEMRQMGRKEWRKRFPGPTFFITGKDKANLSYFWDHVVLKAKSGPNLGGLVDPDSGVAVLDSEMEKLTALDFRDKVKVSEALTAPRGGTIRFSALWQADRTRIQRMAPIEFIGRYMCGWFDFAIADELHQLAGDTAQGNGLGVLGRAAKSL